MTSPRLLLSTPPLTAAMHTIPATQASPDALAHRDAGVAGTFEMLCERLGNLEEIAEHWLRREREKEWMQDGLVDSQLLGLKLPIHVWRHGGHPARPLQETWSAVNIAMLDSTAPADLHLNETRTLKTWEAMQRLGVEGSQLWIGDEAVKCSDVGLDSDFNDLVDAVSEDMLRAAVDREAGDLTLAGFSSAAHPSIFLETRQARAPEYWVGVGSRLFEFCGIATGGLEIQVLCSSIMCVVVPFVRSKSAAAGKKRDLLLKSKACFVRLNQHQRMQEALRNCDFIDYDKMVAEFQRL